jgi:hypothetical protein
VARIGVPRLRQYRHTLGVGPCAHLHKHARTHERTRWVRAAHAGCVPHACVCIRVRIIVRSRVGGDAMRCDARRGEARRGEARRGSLGSTSHSDAACCRMLAIPLSACRRAWCMLQGATACLHGLGERHVHADEVSKHASWKPARSDPAYPRHLRSALADQEPPRPLSCARVPYSTRRGGRDAVPAGDAKVAEPNAVAHAETKMFCPHTTASVAPSPMRPSIVAI